MVANVIKNAPPWSHEHLLIVSIRDDGLQELVGLVSGDIEANQDRSILAVRTRLFDFKHRIWRSP